MTPIRKHYSLMRCILRYRNSHLIRRVANHAKHFVKMKHIITILLALPLFSSAQILVDADFNTGNPTQGIFQTGKLPYYPGRSAQIVSDVVREGAGALRLELHDTDVLRASGRRCEINMPTTSPINPDVVWYAFSHYLPANYISDALPELHMQIADASGLTAPNVALWLWNNKWYVNRKWDTGSGPQEVLTEISNSTAELGGWVDWRIRYVPAIDGSGIIQVYRNGNLVFSHTGPNANAVSGTMVASRYANFGIYKWRWNTPGTYYPNQRIAYYDAIMLGDSTATLSIFTITGTPVTPPAPTGSQAVRGYIFKTN